MKSLLRFAAMSALSLGLVMGVPSADAATKKDKKKKMECCKDGKSAETAQKNGKCPKCAAGQKKT